MTKRQLEELMSNGNEIVWRTIPHIGAKFKILPSLIQATGGFLVTRKLNTFLEDLATSKNSIVFIHSKPDSDEVLWDGMIRYRIVTKSKSVQK